MPGADDPIRTWNYVIRGPKGQWWADVILREDGLFAADSDWQVSSNGYCHRWRGMGTDVRRFFEDMDASYLHSKIGRPRVADPEEIRVALMERLSEEGALDDATRADAIKRIEDSYVEDEHEFSAIVADLPIDCAHECYRMKPEPMSWAFCTKVLPLLQAQIKAEMKSERYV